MNNKKKTRVRPTFPITVCTCWTISARTSLNRLTTPLSYGNGPTVPPETYERARLEGYPADGAQELAMDTLLRGLHYSRYAILREVVENEFADEVPEEKREAFVLKLLPLVGNVFSVYDLSDDNFALSSDYDLLYTELTGATVLYLDEYGV